MTVHDEALAAYIALLEHFDKQTPDKLCALVTDDVRFVDPFNDTRGVDAFRSVFIDARDALADLRFVVSERGWSTPSSNTPVALLRWQLNARLPRLGGRAWQVTGCSALHFSADARVCAHHDYWDAAGQLYEHLPVIGVALRWLRGRLSST